MLSLNPPWVCVCALTRFSERPDRASKNKASSGEASWSGHTWTEWDARAGLALSRSWGQCQPQAISCWKAVPGWWNYEVPGTHIKRNMSSPDPVGSPPQKCGYFICDWVIFSAIIFAIKRAYSQCKAYLPPPSSNINLLLQHSPMLVIYSWSRIIHV